MKDKLEDIKETTNEMKRLMVETGKEVDKTRKRIKMKQKREGMLLSFPLKILDHQVDNRQTDRRKDLPTDRQEARNKNRQAENQRKTGQQT